ncbi:nucleotidyltransferase family protein [Galbibacter sp. BG1]|uniref:nucleotidyltransferase family protein n=1 Tax=Galbibacter sp. BG1 TaxID=1170699 RepID=UPI0015B9E65F|nr:nucleotidyltransferase family protein [Galbibacter sp. BG1]QLE00367.1 nucleotidyltransferase family protein [Galbibacter sp. BG1]
MLTSNQIDIIIKTMMPFNPSKIGIFGSEARNEASEDSDIDILYQFKNTIGLFNLIGLKQNLEKKLNRKVDLVSEKFINPKLKPYILNDLNIIYSDE